MNSGGKDLALPRPSSLVLAATASFFAATLLAVGCAKQGMPPGGPEDKVPPVVVESYPSNGQINTPSDTIITVTFSEGMRKRSVEGSYFSTPPISWARKKWRGEMLSLPLARPLAEETTYLVVLTTRSEDRHGNTLAEPFVLAFSTGESLDSCVVSGRVHLPRTRGKGVPLVRAQDLTLRPAWGLRTEGGERVMQIGNDGSFRLPALLPGRPYVLSAWLESEGDLEIGGRELWGMYAGIVVLADSLCERGEVDIFLWEVGGGELSGSVDSIAGSALTMVSARDTANIDHRYIAFADTAHTFRFEGLPESDYMLTAWCDADRTYSLSVGDLWGQAEEVVTARAREKAAEVFIPLREVVWPEAD